MQAIKYTQLVKAQSIFFIFLFKFIRVLTSTSKSFYLLIALTNLLTSLSTPAERAFQVENILLTSYSFALSTKAGQSLCLETSLSILYTLAALASSLLKKESLRPQHCLYTFLINQQIFSSQKEDQLFILELFVILNKIRSLSALEKLRKKKQPFLIVKIYLFFQQVLLQTIQLVQYSKSPRKLQAILSKKALRNTQVPICYIVSQSFQ